MYRSMNGQMDTWLQTDGQMAINDHPSKKTEDLDDIDQLISQFNYGNIDLFRVVSAGHHCPLY